MMPKFKTDRFIQVGALTLLAALLAPLAPEGRVASHGDAPLIKQDPQANITDVYAFIGTKYNDPEVEALNVVVAVRPFSEPGDGVIYDRFADDARYTASISPTHHRGDLDALRLPFFTDLAGRHGVAL